MRLKKAICVLMSYGILFGFLSGTASAVPMKNILGEKLFQGGPILIGHIIKLQDFIKEEKSKLLSENGYYLENIKRNDNLSFSIFCCFCYTHGLNRYIDNVVKQRSPSERREDLDTMRHMMDDTDRFNNLCDRFEIGDISSEDISDLVRFIIDCTPKIKTSRESTRRKPGRDVREEMRRGLESYSDEGDY